MLLDQRPALAALTVLDLVMIVFTVIVAIHFFHRHRRTRILFPVLLLANVYYAVLSAGVIAVTFQTTFESKALARPILYGVIWLPYFLISKRVLQTFTLPPVERHQGIALQQEATHRKWRIWKAAAWIGAVITVSIFVLILAERRPPASIEFKIGVSFAFGVFGFIVVLMGGWVVNWIVGYPHLGWKRLALVTSPIVALIVAAATSDERYPGAWLGWGLATLAATPFVILLGRDLIRNCVKWVIQGFKHPTAGPSTSDDAPSKSQSDRREP